jgi:hypothetical protein
MGAKGCLWASRTSTTSRRPGTTSCCRSTTRSCAYSVARSTRTVAPDRAGGHQPACELELLSISRRDQSFATSNRNRERERGVQPPPENLGGPKLFPAPLPGPALSPAGHSQGGRTLSAQQAGPARARARRFDPCPRITTEGSVTCQCPNSTELHQTQANIHHAAAQKIRGLSSPECVGVRFRNHLLICRLKVRFLRGSPTNPRSHGRPSKAASMSAVRSQGSPTPGTGSVVRITTEKDWRRLRGIPAEMP